MDNGQFFQEAGKINEKTGAQEVAGSYSFAGADGQTYWVKYTADEEGFHPIVGKLSFPFGMKQERNQNIYFNKLFLSSSNNQVPDQEDQKLLTQTR